MILTDIIDSLADIHDLCAFGRDGDRQRAKMLLDELSKLEGFMEECLEMMAVPRTELDVDGNEIPSYRIP